MRLHHILHKNSMGQLLRISRDYFWPPQSLKKDIDNIFIIRIHFRRVFVEFVVFLTKIWLKKIIFRVTAKCWRDDCFCPSHQEVIDAI